MKPTASSEAGEKSETRKAVKKGGGEETRSQRLEKNLKC